MATSELPGVFSEMCSTCVFRPGNLMRLRPGRLKDIVDENVAKGTLLICHKTTFGQAQEQIVCRGFYDIYGPKLSVYQIINRIGGFREVTPPDDQDGY